MKTERNIILSVTVFTQRALIVPSVYNGLCIIDVLVYFSLQTADGQICTKIN